MDASESSELAAVIARLDELSRECARLSQENSELRAQMSRLAPSASAAVDGRVRAAAASRKEERTRTAGRTVSRRMMGKAIGAAAASVVGAVALSDAIAGPAAATNGNAIFAGVATTAESATEVVYNGSSDPGVAFLVNDTSDLGPSDSVHPAALGGWAGTECTTGVYGFTEVNGGDGVIGVVGGSSTGNGVHGVAFQSGQAGVLGENSSGPGISGTSGSIAGGAAAIIGTITSTDPGGFSAGVRGVNNGTFNAGTGVYGSHAGNGLGVYGTSVRGIGVEGTGGTGTGVSGTGGSAGVSGFGGAFGVTGAGVTGVGADGVTTGVAATGATAVHATGTATGVSATGPTAVHATGSSTGVSATGPTAIHATGSSTGVSAKGPTAVQGSGSGNGGRGGVFSGAAAQIQLTPGSLSTHPKSGKRGDLYADKTGRLWFCKSGGNSAVWHEIA